MPLLAGCGDGAGPPQVGHPASGPITPQRVEEFARAVNLRAADLPGAESRPAEETKDPATERVTAECLGGLPFGEEVASVDSPYFQFREGQQAAVFASSVWASHTVEEAETMLETLGGASGFPCYEWALLHALDQEAEDETEVLSPQVWRIEGPLPLGTDGLGVRIHASLREGDEENELYADIITFAAGHAMVSLTAVGLSDPVNQDVEAALALQLLERAERHPL